MDGNTYPLLHDTKMIIGECEVVKALLHHSASNPEKMGRILLHGIGGKLGDHVWDFVGTSSCISTSGRFNVLVATDQSLSIATDRH